eukprot:gene6507-11968_t
METRCKVRYNLEEALQYVVTPGSDSEISDLEDDDGEDLDKIQLEREPCQEASVMSDNCEIIKDGIEDASQSDEERGILTTATIRNNRLAGCTLKSEKEMKKDGRGSFGFQTDQNTGMVVLRWFDNKCVTLVSTYLNVDETVNVKRWNSSSKTHVDPEDTNMGTPTERQNIQPVYVVMSTVITVLELIFTNGEWHLLTMKKSDFKSLIAKSDTPVGFQRKGLLAHDAVPSLNLSGQTEAQVKQRKSPLSKKTMEPLESIGQPSFASNWTDSPSTLGIFTNEMNLELESDPKDK